MKALILDAAKRTGTMAEISKPAPSADELLIEVHAIALNPVDALYTAHPLGSTGRVIGSDFSGTVIELGSSVPTTSNILLGDRVAGFLQGACSVNDRPGAFAELLICPWDLVWKIGSLTFEEAATVSLCALTAAQALFLRLGVPAPFHDSGSGSDDLMSPKSIFINGATTSVGLYAAQLARKAGLEVVVGSASPRHHSFLVEKPYAYKEIVDYRLFNWPEKVRAVTGLNGVDIAFDCISEGESVLNTHRTLNGEFHPSGAARVGVVRSRTGGAWDTSVEQLDGLEPSYGAVWEGLGADVEYQGMTLPANAEMRAFTVRFYKWLSEHGIVPNLVRLMPGGLERVVEGLGLLGSGSIDERQSKKTESEWLRPVSAEKLVYVIK